MEGKQIRLWIQAFGASLSLPQTFTTSSMSCLCQMRQQLLLGRAKAVVFQHLHTLPALHLTRQPGEELRVSQCCLKHRQILKGSSKHHAMYLEELQAVQAGQRKVKLQEPTCHNKSGSLSTKEYVLHANKQAICKRDSKRFSEESVISNFHSAEFWAVILYAHSVF